MNNKIVGIIVFTIIELAALVGWLALVLQGNNIAGIAVLIIGLVLEHLVSYNVFNKRPLFNFSGIPLGGLLLISATETLIWVVWLVLSQGSGIVIGAVFLVITMFLQHSVERNVFLGKPLFDHIVKTEVIGFTVIEAVAAAVWLFFVLDPGMSNIVGAGILGIGLLVEHIIQTG